MGRSLWIYLGILIFFWKWLKCIFYHTQPGFLQFCLLSIIQLGVPVWLSRCLNYRYLLLLILILVLIIRTLEKQRRTPPPPDKQFNLSICHLLSICHPPPNRKSLLDMCRYISMRSRRKTYFRQKHPTFLHFYFVKGSSNWSWHTAEWRYNSALNKHDLYSSSLNGVRGFAWSNSRR